MIDEKKLIAEIERLMNELIKEKKKGYGSDADDACVLELQNVLTFINSLPEEPVSEDLEEAADKALNTFDVADMMCGSYEGWKMLEMFKLGAQ